MSLALAQPTPSLPPGPGLVGLAIELLEVATARDPSDLFLLARLAQLHQLRAMLLVDEDRTEAVRSLARAEQAFERVWQAEPRSVWSRSSRCELRTVTAALALRDGRTQLAGRELRAVVGERRRLVTARSGTPWARRRLTIAHRELARTAALAGSRRTAMTATEAMLAAARDRVSGPTDDPRALPDLAEALEQALGVAQRFSETASLASWSRELLEVQRRRVSTDPADAELRAHEVAAAVAAVRTGAAKADEASAAFSALRAAAPDHPRLRLFEVEVAHVACEAALRAGDAEAAVTSALAACQVPAVVDPGTERGRARLADLHQLLTAALALADPTDPRSPAATVVADRLATALSAATPSSDPGPGSQWWQQAFEVVAGSPLDPAGTTPEMRTVSAGLELPPAPDPEAWLGLGLAADAGLLAIGVPGATVVPLDPVDGEPTAHGSPGAADGRRGEQPRDEQPRDEQPRDDQPRDDQVGAPAAGVVHVVARTDSGSAEIRTLRPQDPVADGRFGWAVAVADDQVVVGAPGMSLPDPQRPPLPGELLEATGAAFVFRRTGTGDDKDNGWELTDRLTPPPGVAATAFGTTVAVAGNVLAVGDPTADGTGGVALFRHDGHRWRGEAWLPGPPSDPPVAGELRFGASLALSTDRLVVGAPGQPPVAPGGASGTAWVFERSGDDWVPVARLDPPPHVRGRDHGLSVALHDDVVAVGAPRIGPVVTSGGVVPPAGLVCLYRTAAADGWSAAQTLAPPGTPAPHGQVSGAEAQSLEAQGVKTQIEEVQGVEAQGVDVDRSFGTQVLLTAGWLAVGAPRASLAVADPEDGAATDPGAAAGVVHLLARSGRGWEPTARLVPPDPQGGQAFGGRLACWGDEVVIASPYRDVAVSGSLNAEVFQHGLVHRSPLSDGAPVSS